MLYAVSVFLFFLFIQTLFGISSLRGGFSFLRFVRRKPSKVSGSDIPETIVFVPCKGVEDGLRENLDAVLSQDVDAKVVFIVDQPEDAAVEVISELGGGELLVAGMATDSGQKVHNLIKAVEEYGDHADIFVFADSDARPERKWLLNLISPLINGQATVSTGYRWFAPQRFGVFSQLRSAWNASITSSLGENESSNFCWGGSMAIKKIDFERLDVIKNWEGTVSDDFVLTNLVKRENGSVRFVPQCLNASVDGCTASELLEFAARQMKITRVYSPEHFKISVIGSVLFCLTFFGGILILPVLRGLPQLIAASLLTTIWILGTAKAAIRYFAIRLCLPEKAGLSGYFWHMVLWPFATLVFLFANIAALRSRRIVWRGIPYELVSSNETKIG